MKSNHKYKYIKPEQKGQIIFIIFIILAIMAGLIWSVIEEDQKILKPDVTYPMANAHISWNQTFHGGAWNE